MSDDVVEPVEESFPLVPSFEHGYYEDTWWSVPSPTGTAVIPTYAWSIDEPVAELMGRWLRPGEAGWAMYLTSRDSDSSVPWSDMTVFDELVARLAAITGPAASDPIWGENGFHLSHRIIPREAPTGPTLKLVSKPTVAEAMDGLDPSVLHMLSYRYSIPKGTPPGFTFHLSRRPFGLTIQVWSTVGCDAAEAATLEVADMVDRLVGERGVMAMAPALSRPSPASIPGVGSRFGDADDVVGMWGWVVDVDRARADRIEELAAGGSDRWVFERRDSGRGRLRCRAGLDTVTPRDIRAVGELLAPLLPERNHFDPSRPSRADDIWMS